MIYKEEKCDLLKIRESKQGRLIYIAHCISADFALGAGVAKALDNKYSLRDDLIKSFGPMWYESFRLNEKSEIIFHPNKNIIDLVTKQRYWHKPTLASMRSALCILKDFCVGEEDVKYLAMPKIGCGLDKLNWNDVSKMIQEIFADTNIEITICCL